MELIEKRQFGYSEKEEDYIGVTCTFWARFPELYCLFSLQVDFFIKKGKSKTKIDEFSLSVEACWFFKVIELL